MPKLAANLTMLFGEVEFLSRFAAAASAGFEAVEYLFPYDYEPDILKQHLHDHGLVQVLHNLPAGNWAAGERGIACLAERVAEFRAGIDRAIEYAGALDCDRVNCLAGILPQTTDPATARETLIHNLQYAAPRLKAAGVKLLIEPINTRDVPGFFLSGTRQAVEIIEAVGSDNLFLQYDIYHMQIMEGNLAPTIQSYLPRIGHMQLADSPGRHEPGTGEIDFGFLLEFVDRARYTGWIGCEYIPKGETVEGLRWATPYLR
ncbi:MAG: hydroxypyruvate isomerase [Acidobacteria bacterium]|nr:hydroxypyruvate isomerase [Acidobacteriota bacterium]MCA1649065.1 hydroxypyruvate isomerase [Acidobacteriota bacterium]